MPASGTATRASGTATGDRGTVMRIRKAARLAGEAAPCDGDAAQSDAGVATRVAIAEMRRAPRVAPPLTRRVLRLLGAAAVGGTAVAALCRLNVAAVMARCESTPALLRVIDERGLEAAGPAASELVDRLCRGELHGDAARDLVRALWRRRVTIDPTASVGETMSVNARLVAPSAVPPRDSASTLAWRLVEVQFGGRPPVAIDSAPTLTHLGGGEAMTRWDELHLPADCVPGVTDVSCEYAFELLDAAGGRTCWRERFDQPTRVFAADPPAR